MNLAILVLQIVILVSLGCLARVIYVIRGDQIRHALRLAHLETESGETLVLARQAQQEREHERAATDRLEIGSFVPSDEDAARLERQHQGAQRGFLSARGPRP